MGPKLEAKFKKINDVILFNDTDDISTNRDTNKDTFLVPVGLFQVVARGCVPCYPGLKGVDVFEAIFEYVNVCEIYIFYVIYIFFSVKITSFIKNIFWAQNVDIKSVSL